MSQKYKNLNTGREVAEARAKALVKEKGYVMDEKHMVVGSPGKVKAATEMKTGKSRTTKPGTGVEVKRSASKSPAKKKAKSPSKKKKKSSPKPSPAKPKKKKASPKKPKSPSNVIKIPASVPEPSEIMNMKVAELKDLAVNLDIKISGMKKADLQEAILKKIGKRVSSKKVPTPKLTPKDVEKLLCIDKDGNNICPEGFCNVKTGKCVKKTKAGRPYGEAKLKADIDDFEVDTDLGFLGPRSIVGKYRLRGRKPSAKKEPSPKKAPSPAKKAAKKKASRCDDKDDYVKCDDDQLCSSVSGRCVKDSAVNRKGKKVLITGDGRKIAGEEKVLKELQKVLGGKIEGEMTEAEKAKASQEEIKVPIEPKAKTPPKKAKTPPKVKVPSVKKARTPPKVKVPSAKKDAEFAFPQPQEELPPGVTEKQKNEIIETFKKCLASLQ